MKEFLLRRYPFLSDYLGNSSSIKAKLAGGFVWAFIAKASNAVLGVVLSVLLARLFSPQEVGGYFVFTNVIGVSATLASMGLYLATVKVVAEALASRQTGRARGAIRWVFIVGSLSSFTAGLVLLLGGAHWLGAYVFDMPLMGDFSILLAFWLFTSNVQFFIGEVFRGMKDMRWASLFGGQGAATRLLIFLALGVAWLASLRITFWSVVLITVICQVVTLFLAILLLWRSISLWGNDQSVFEPGAFFVLLGPMWVTAVVSLALSWADVTFVGMLLPEQQVALYGIGNRLSYVVNAPLLMMNAVLMPMVAELYKLGQTRRLEKLLRLSSTLFTAPALAVFLIFIFWGVPLLRVLFGEYYVQAYYPLLFLSFGQLVNVATGSSGLLMNMGGLHKQFMWISLGIGLSQLFFYNSAIESYGITGAAFINSLFRVLISVIVMYYAYYKLKIRTWPGLV